LNSFDTKKESGSRLFIIYDIIDKSNPPLNNNSTNSSASSLKDFWTKRFSLCFQKTNAINLLSQAGSIWI
jgi:hypothetical protein